MSSLKDLQQGFMDFVYKQESLRPDQFVNQLDSLSAENCLQVYRDSVFGNLTNALGDIYPALKQCVGERFFNAMAQQYIEKHPSSSASLDHYGEHLASFISDFAPLTDLPYTHDLARLEWMWHCAFHAKDEGPMDMSKLVDAAATDSTDELVLKLFESARLLESDFPVHDIWKLSTAEINATEPLTNEVDLNQGRQTLLIWRSRDYEMRIDPLSLLEFEVLKSIKKGSSLGTIFDQLGSKYAPEEINQVLSTAVQKCWLAD